MIHSLNGVDIYAQPQGGHVLRKRDFIRSPSAFLNRSRILNLLRSMRFEPPNSHQPFRDGGPDLPQSRFRRGGLLLPAEIKVQMLFWCLIPIMANPIQLILSRRFHSTQRIENSQFHFLRSLRIKLVFRQEGIVDVDT